MRSVSYFLVVVFICTSILAVIHTYTFITTPSNPPESLLMEIKPGTSAWEISRQLEEKGVITDSLMFMAIATGTGKVTHLQAGTYVFEGRHYPLDIMHILFKGRTLKYRITIPEGSTIFDIASIVAETGLLSREEFFNSAQDPETTAFFGIDAPSMEGFLYPDTYYLAPHMTPREIMGKMVERFHEVFTGDMLRRAQELDMSVAQVVILASIIEKEAVLSREMPIISSVFHNRLKCGMRLQSDPTAIYGIDGFRRRISSKDLKRDTPYNTYRYGGLPPGPICNPGVKAISAALWPADTKYLFFVSQGNGTHYFSRSHTEHRDAIRKMATK
ncbi:MAG TPA: endolytic transglycosylase MltG [Deltaproteobacteria bacterium]|nr:endolytic transglycosylase MltG [Deltaproteobacteria bacterium]